jgi:hypothetical protein
VEHDRSRRFGGKIAGRCWERWGFELENASGQPQLAVRPCPFEREALFGSGACAAATARRRRCRTARAAWPTAGRSQKEVHLLYAFSGRPGQGVWGLGPLGAGRWGLLPASERTGLDWPLFGTRSQQKLDGPFWAAFVEHMLALPGPGHAHVVEKEGARGPLAFGFFFE